MQLASDHALHYYYFGFYTVLRRYRTMTLIGWGTAAVSVVGIGAGWQYGMVHGVLDVAIGVAAFSAGLGLVQQSVAGLSQYLGVPFNTGDGEADPAVVHIKHIMADVDAGGWQEAFLAIRALEEMHTTYGLPELP
jgi:hypothetical protein